MVSFFELATKFVTAMISTTLSLLVAIFTIFRVMFFSLFQNFLLALLFDVLCCHRFLFLLFGIILVEVRKPLDHGVYFLVIIAHKHFLERSLRWQIESFQEIGLPSLVGFNIVLEGLNFLF